MLECIYRINLLQSFKYMAITINCCNCDGRINRFLLQWL